MGDVVMKPSQSSVGRQQYGGSHHDGDPSGYSFYYKGTVPNPQVHRPGRAQHNNQEGANAEEEDAKGIAFSVDPVETIVNPFEDNIAPPGDLFEEPLQHLIQLPGLTHRGVFASPFFASRHAPILPLKLTRSVYGKVPGFQGISA
jgi:hypothetical protein